MPILWKYLLKSYFQFLTLCTSAFVAVLLVIRFQEIAQFASSGASLKHIGLFSLYQIPYILPIAIPISCLIASMILFQRMSFSLEFTALRACGIAIKSITAPILLSSLLLGVINFSIASEITPITRTKAKHLMYEVIQENPLILMQKDSMLGLKTAEFDLKKLKLGKKAAEVLCIMRQSSGERIGLFTAKEISTEGNFVLGKDISILSTFEASPEGYDHLMIENQKTMKINKQELTNHLLKTEWFAKDDLLNFKGILHKSLLETGPFPSKSFLEVLRRIFLGLCPLTFTLIGLCFGTNIGRSKKKTPVLFAFSLAALVMICFVATKTLQKFAILSLLLYLLPQPIAALLSLKSLFSSSRGIE